MDLLDPELYGDIARMHDVFRGLRARPGLQRDTRNNLWAAVHHDDLIEVERNDRVFVSGQGFRATPSPMERDMIALDDPEHAEQRRLIARRFTPKSVKALEPFVVTLVDELIDAVIDDGELDVVDDLAAQMPARLTAHLLGFPEEIWADIKSWSERLMRYDETNRDETALQGFVGAIMEFSQVLGPLIEQRRAEPADDLVSVWAKSSLADCPMADDVIMQETGLVISGGAETTRTVIGRGLAELCSHSDQWEAIAVAPESIPVAVEELIRWVTPLNNFFRTATDDVRVGDVGVANGDRVILLYPSANRDEKHFDRPDELDLTRQPNRMSRSVSAPISAWVRRWLGWSCGCCSSGWRHGSQGSSSLKGPTSRRTSSWARFGPAASASRRGSAGQRLRYSPYTTPRKRSTASTVASVRGDANESKACCAPGSSA